jgi:hypothetical protein
MARFRPRITENSITVRDNSDLDVNDLMAQVHDQVLRRGESESAAAVRDVERTYVYASELDADSIEALLHNARKMAQIRTAWPRRLWIFPFSISRSLRRVFLRLFAFIFNDQRHVNFALTEAIRQQLQITKELHGLVAAQQSELRHLEDRLERIERRNAK